MAHYFVETGDNGRQIISGIANEEDVLEKVLASIRAPKPVQFFAELVIDDFTQWP